MKKFFTLSLFAILFSFSSISFSQTFLEENFNYPAGDTIGGHGWTTFSSSVNPIQVVAPGLTYTGYPQSGIGNAAKLLNTGQDAYRDISTIQSSGSVYTAFMVKVDTARTGDYFLAFLPSTSTTNYTGRVYAKDSLGLLSFGLSRTTAAAGGIVYTSPVYQYGTTYLLVLKYQFNSGTTTDDVVSLYVFAQPLVPPVEPVTPTVGPLTGTATDLTDVGRVALRQGSTASSPTLVIDGIRTFNTWNKIVSVNNISVVAEDFKLYQNYPNPFNPSTTIKFSVPQSGKVTLKVYNTLGEMVEQLADQNVSAGSYSVNFDAAGLNSGVYFYTLTHYGSSGAVYTDSKKLLLIK